MPLAIAFYAPLKPPDHPVPSGDRLMARHLMAALRMAGHKVTLASDLRAYQGDPGDTERLARLQADAAGERARLAADWVANGAPDLWVCYHPYVKSPDLIGPALTARFGVPMVTCEASYSPRRNIGLWATTQEMALGAVRQAVLNLCLTARDEAGLRAAAPDARLERLAPFIDTAPFATPPSPQPGHIVTVAMMRPGDKLDSYRLLATALALLPQTVDWRLSVAGDGPERAAVHALFAGLPADRIAWLGALPPDGIARLLAQGAVYLWPGCGEAYGLAYLEAQAAGLPVIACRTAGVPEVVSDATGVLVPLGDVAALAQTLADWLADPARTALRGLAARDHVARHHSMMAASARLQGLIASLGIEGARA